MRTDCLVRVCPRGSPFCAIRIAGFDLVRLVRPCVPWESVVPSCTSAGAP